MKREGGLLLTLVVLIVAMNMLSPYFLRADNLLSLSRHLAEVGIIACAMTCVIATGGIDLSVGSLMGLTSISLGYASLAWDPAAGMAIALATGLLGGLFNGALIAHFTLPPLVVTLATMALFRGLAMTISQAQPVSEFAPIFDWIGQGSAASIPTQLWIWCIVYAANWAVLEHTGYGRYLRAIGDNSRAARSAMLPVKRVLLCSYATMGLLCALAGIVYTSRVSTARADAGTGLELEVITAVVLGGTSITGGRASLIGTLLGVLILGIVRNGASLAGVPSVWQAIVAGTILIAAAALNRRLTDRGTAR